MSGRYIHHFVEVGCIEALLGSLTDSRHRILEALEWVPASFDMRIIGGKKEKLLSTLIDYPADRFSRMRREFDLAPNVVGSLRWQGQSRLGAGKNLLSDIKPFEPRNNPQCVELYYSAMLPALEKSSGLSIARVLASA